MQHTPTITQHLKTVASFDLDTQDLLAIFLLWDILTKNSRYAQVSMTAPQIVLLSFHKGQDHRWPRQEWVGSFIIVFTIYKEVALLGFPLGHIYCISVATCYQHNNSSTNYSPFTPVKVRLKLLAYKNTDPGLFLIQRLNLKQHQGN